MFVAPHGVIAAVPRVPTGGGHYTAIMTIWDPVLPKHQSLVTNDPSRVQQRGQVASSEEKRREEPLSKLIQTTADQTERPPLVVKASAENLECLVLELSDKNAAAGFLHPSSLTTSSPVRRLFQDFTDNNPTAASLD